MSRYGANVYRVVIGTRGACDSFVISDSIVHGDVIVIEVICVTNHH